MTDDVLRGKVAGDRTDFQTARKPLMYVHMELMIKCMHVGSIKTDSASLCGGVQGGWANWTYSSGSLEG